MADKLNLVPVTREPTSIVELHPDRVVFNTVAADGKIVDGFALTLTELIERGDATALLLFGVMMQMNQLRALIENAQSVATAINPLDPDFIRSKMSDLIPMVMQIMKDGGFPGMPGAPSGGGSGE